MPEYSKVEDMPIGATITGIRMSESDDAIKPLAFPVTQVETDSKKRVHLHLQKFQRPSACRDLHCSRNLGRMGEGLNVRTE